MRSEAAVGILWRQRGYAANDERRGAEEEERGSVVGSALIRNCTEELRKLSVSHEDLSVSVKDKEAVREFFG